MPLKKKKKIVKKKTLKRPPVKRKAVKKSTKKPVKKTSKKPVKKSTKKLKPKLELPVIGNITHYFPHVKAAVIKLKAPLSMGDQIRVKGYTTDFTQTVTSIQMDHAPIRTAKKGQEVGLQVISRVRRRDKVYKA